MNEMKDDGCRQFSRIRIFFFKIQNTRFLRFLEMTCQNVEIFIKVSE